MFSYAPSPARQPATRGALVLPFSPPSALHDSEGRDPVAKLAAAAALLGRGGAVTRGARGSCFLRALTCLQPSARGALAPPLSPRSAIYGSDGRDPAVALDAPAVFAMHEVGARRGRRDDCFVGGRVSPAPDCHLAH